MTRTPRFATGITLLLVVLAMTFGCKSSNPDPGPTNLTSLQGSWKITGLTIDPAFTYNGVALTNLSSALQLLGENCLADAVITFNANKSITNNLSTQASCTNATTTKALISSFFGPTTTYTESGNQVTLTTGTQNVVATNVYTTTTATLTTKLPADPLGKPVATPYTYTLVLTKQ